MKKEQFTRLIQLATGRDFQIDTSDEELKIEHEYYVYRTLPVTKRHISFKWVTPKTDDKFLRSFVTAFTSKYREPNPEAYNHDESYCYGASKWTDKTPEQQEFAYYHHSSNMYSKKALLEQVEANFNNPNITSGLNRYGFYATEYGIGTFVLFATQYVQQSIKDLANYLTEHSIAYSNEYSEAGWVLRFKINASKEIHEGILNGFTHKK